MRLDIELLQLIDRQVNAPAHRVFPHIAQDVGELQGLAQLVGVLGGLRVGLAEDAGRHFTHHAGHQVAIALLAGVVAVAGWL